MGKSSFQFTKKKQGKITMNLYLLVGNHFILMHQQFLWVNTFPLNLAFALLFHKHKDEVFVSHLLLFWAPLWFYEILMWTNLHSVIVYYRMLWSLTIASIKWEIHLVHSRLQKRPLTAFYFRGFWNGSSYKVVYWDLFLEASVPVPLNIITFAGIEHQNSICLLK